MNKDKLYNNSRSWSETDSARELRKTTVACKWRLALRRSPMADYPKDIEKNQHSTGDLLQSNAGLSHPDSSRMGNEASEDKSFSESRYGESEDNADKSSQVSQGKNSHPKLRLMIRFAIGLLLFSVVLACVTFSKLTLIRLTDQLRNLTVNTNVTSKAVSGLQFLPSWL